MAIMATGQISIIDYNDALTLTGFIGSNLAKSQMFNPDNGSYNPDWTQKNLVLTPSLYKLGTTNDVITSSEVISVKWFEASSNQAITNNENYTLSGQKNHILTIKRNLLSGLPARDWICEVTYKDLSTNLNLIHKTSITFSRVVNGGGIADAVTWCPDGNIFKNNSISSLTAQCDLWRGSIIDDTNVSYQWYQQDSSIDVDQGGGKGWKKLIDSPGKFLNCTSNKMTVFNEAVLDFAVFKCVIKDTDSASNTYNKTFMDTISFIDNSDPIQVSIESSGGDVFKNGIGSTTLNARLFQAGNEIDLQGTKYTYSWKKFDKNGILVPEFKKQGKKITIGSDDVDIKATFSIEVS